MKTAELHAYMRGLRNRIPGMAPMINVPEVPLKSRLYMHTSKYVLSRDYQIPAQFGGGRRGKKQLNFSSDNNARPEPWRGGGRRVCYVAPELSYDYTKIQ